jgi:hypothetical protein
LSNSTFWGWRVFSEFPNNEQWCYIYIAVGLYKLISRDKYRAGHAETHPKSTMVRCILQAVEWMDCILRQPTLCFIS